ncbi:Uncharacterised protein [Yersinia aldovae]|nr:hypothetical protein [Yersinia aldovae]CNH70170.1 Uncharacterised protein [Yersinia aldovae]
MVAVSRYNSPWVALADQRNREGLLSLLVRLVLYRCADAGDADAPEL